VLARRIVRIGLTGDSEGQETSSNFMMELTILPSEWGTQSIIY